MDCAKCGGECYDNREKVNDGWKGPVFKCKDAECGWTQWPPKGERKGRGGGGGKAPAGPKPTWKELAARYGKCRDIAVFTWKGVPSVADDPSALVAAAATLFIEANRNGIREEGAE